MGLPTGDLSVQTTVSDQTSINVHIHKPVTLRRHQICELLSENRPQRYSKGGNNFDVAQRDNGVFENGSEEAYQGADTLTVLVGWNLAV